MIPLAGDAALADVQARQPVRLQPRLRIPVRVRGDADPPRQLRGPRAVPSLAALAAGGVGPVPHLARGDARPMSAWSRLFLALGAIARGWRSDPAIRSLAVVAGLTLVLSLGPYVPGFGWLVRLPGFSFFRAPARWGLATSLALSLLAGRGFDSCRSWPRAGRSARRFVAVCLAGGPGGGPRCSSWRWSASSGDEWKPVASGFERGLNASPGRVDPAEKSFRDDHGRGPAAPDRYPVAGGAGPARRPGCARPGPFTGGHRFAIYGRGAGRDRGVARGPRPGERPGVAALGRSRRRSWPSRSPTP